MSFEAYAEQDLALGPRPAEIVVLDGLSCHRSPPGRRAIEAVGVHLWHLGMYIPDFNSTELRFASLEAYLRAARFRTLEVIW